MGKRKVTRILTRIKNRENIGFIRVEKEKRSVSINDSSNETVTELGNGSAEKKLSFDNAHTKVLSSTQKILLARKTGDKEYLYRLKVSRAIVEILGTISKEVTDIPYHPVQMENMVKKWGKQLVALDDKLYRLKIPIVMYLRIHMALHYQKHYNNLIRIAWLSSENALDLFIREMERNLSEKYLLPVDVERALQNLSVIEHDNPLVNLLEEYMVGVEYMESVRSYNSLLDDDLLLMMELKNLPGAYIVALENYDKLEADGIIRGEIREKVDKARNSLSIPGVETKFFSEIRN